MTFTSTGVISPTSGTSAQYDRQLRVSHPVNGRILSNSSSLNRWSAIALTSGYVMCEQWHK